MFLLIGLKGKPQHLLIIVLEISSDHLAPSAEITASEPNIVIPSATPGLDSNHFFAPISPADKTGANSIVDLLQQASSGGIGGPDPLGPSTQPPIGPPGLHGSQPPPSIKDLSKLWNNTYLSVNLTVYLYLHIYFHICLYRSI